MTNQINSPWISASCTWRKSSYSSSYGGACLEVTDLTSHIGIRDSKCDQGPALIASTTAWHIFLTFATGPAGTA
ncbi:DUF397 domain-containing protein [Streptomyces sp. CAU 1734]|uniref:DUF397 domain-containing protein n=1 Tax=Streptomyces sp. CAU 1734 TaxID=3140360 RepID=UPI003260F9C7